MSLTYLRGLEVKQLDVEHLDYKWVMREELLSYEFIEGDVEFVNSLVIS